MKSPDFHVTHLLLLLGFNCSLRWLLQLPREEIKKFRVSNQQLIGSCTCRFEVFTFGQLSNTQEGLCSAAEKMGIDSSHITHHTSHMSECYKCIIGALFLFANCWTPHDSHLCNGSLENWPIELHPCLFLSHGIKGKTFLPVDCVVKFY